MAEAAVINLVCRQGRTFSKTFEWRVNGVLQDLTDVVGRMQVRIAPGPSAVYAELSTTNGCMVLGGTAGTVSLALPDTGSNSTAIGARVYQYDIKLTFPDGSVDWATGTFTVEPTVTQ